MENFELNVYETYVEDLEACINSRSSEEACHITVTAEETRLVVRPATGRAFFFADLVFIYARLNELSAYVTVIDGTPAIILFL